MLAADTNVLVRLLVSDDLVQQKAALRRLSRARDRGEHVLVSTVVLAELAWVLESVYGYGRDALADALRRFLDTPPFHLRERGELQQALEWHATGAAGLSDYLVLALAQAEGADALLSFDRSLLKTRGVERP